jgi:WD40 repeat protein
MTSLSAPRSAVLKALFAALVLWSLLPQAAYPQTKLTGVVVDSIKKKGLDGIKVEVMAGARPLADGPTKNGGKYSISFAPPAKGVLVTVWFRGFNAGQLFGWQKIDLLIGEEDQAIKLALNPAPNKNSRAEAVREQASLVHSYIMTRATDNDSMHKVRQEVGPYLEHLAEQSGRYTAAALHAELGSAVVAMRDPRPVIGFGDNTVFTQERDGKLMRWDMGLGKKIWDSSKKFTYCAGHSSFRDGLLVVPKADGIALWDLREEFTDRPPTILQPETGAVRLSTASPSGKYFAVSGDNGLVTIFVKREKVFQQAGYLYAGPSNVGAMAFSAKEDKLAVVGLTGLLHVWDAPSGKTELKLSLEGVNLATSIAFAPDGKFLVVGSGLSGHGKVYRVDTMAKKASLFAEWKGGISDLGYAQDGRTILVGSNATQSVSFLDASTGSAWKSMERTRGTFLLAPDGKSAVLIQLDGTPKAVPVNR